MLPLQLVRCRSSRNRLVPQYLDPTSAAWLDIAEQVLDLFRRQAGRSRGELESELEELIGNHPGQIVFRGLAKLCEDRCEFEMPAEVPPEQVREAVFAAAAIQRAQGRFHRHEVLEQVGRSLGLDAEAVERTLFADLKSEQRLTTFRDLTAAQLIDRYNVACAQAVLFRATQVVVEVRGASVAQLRGLLRAIKFRRLMCEVEATGTSSISFRLDGPLSLFQSTTRYGVQLALFLPHLLLCRDFELRAELRWGAKRTEKHFVLTAADGLRSHLPDTTGYVPQECAMFVELFRQRAPGWDITEAAELVPLGRGWWVPDYRLTHRATGRHVYLEILGYWRRTSAEKHIRSLREGLTAPCVVAVSEQLRLDDSDTLPEGAVRFRSMPQPDDIIRAAEALLPNRTLFDG